VFFYFYLKLKIWKQLFMSIFIKPPFFALLLVSTVFIAGCANTAKDLDGDASRLAMCKERVSVVEERFKKQEYGRIKNKLEEILALCPGTGYMEQAQFMLAESFFNLEEWIEARGEYGSFVLNFPGSPYAETAEFRKAVSSFNMEFHIARDDTQTTVAMKDFERFTSNYPESPLADSVDFYYNKLINRLAEREFQTANLYYKLEKPKAVVIYLKDFLTLYPQSERRFDAYVLTAKSYSELDLFDEARHFLSTAKTDPLALHKKKEQIIAKLEQEIDKAEARFEKRVAKEISKKRLRKQEAEDFD
jgi:outer membrane protein assembly factor BamD